MIKKPDDPFNFYLDSTRKGVASFDTEKPLHPLLQSYLYGQDFKDQLYHSLGNTIRGQDVGPLCDALLQVHLFMGGINSRTGFTSSENNFCVLAPVVIFQGKQKFTCRFLNYPSYTAGPITARSDAPTLPAESFDVSFSVDMFGIKVSIEPEVNLLCTPEARLQEFLLRKEQISKSINQTMQEQITHALANCPTLTMMRLRNDYSNISRMCSMPETLKEFVYSEIQREAREFCSWTLNAISPQGALQDAYSSLLFESKSEQKPNYIVTTPEIADFIAQIDSYKTTENDVLYTVAFSDDKGLFVPGHIVPYQGVNKKVALTTRALNVSGVTLPILQVPHLNRECNSKYNMFEHNESFWVFNEVGYLSGLNGATVQDFKPVVRTAIRVTDLHSGRDGKFTMDDCLRCGGGLLPDTFDRYKYQEMLRSVPGLLQFLQERTNQTGMLNYIGKRLPLNSPYVFYFPSAKVRYTGNRDNNTRNMAMQPLFRSTGIYGNRPSFENWHPPQGDLEAAKDWLANKVHIGENGFDDLEEYLRKCAEIPWTTEDFNLIDKIESEFADGEGEIGNGQNILEHLYIKDLLKDLIRNQGYSKFVSIPKYFDLVATVASRTVQASDNKVFNDMFPVDEDNVASLMDRPEKRDMTEWLNRIVSARALLFRVGKRLIGLVSRVDIPEGVLTDCPSTIPDFGSADTTSETKAIYRFYLLCVVPLVYKNLFSIQTAGEAVQFKNYKLVNPCRKHVYQANGEETFLQPEFKRVVVTNVSQTNMLNAFQDFNLRFKEGSLELKNVGCYDPLLTFDLDVIKEEDYSRNTNFFDHFVSHRFKFLRETTDESFMVRVMAAFLNMTRYTPTVEKALGHDCLMNRKYRVIRQCNLTVGMVGLYSGGKDSMMYAVGNLSTVTKPTANNGIMITNRVCGNCFIVDPLSSGRVIHNAVSKNLNSGMTSTLMNVTDHVSKEGKFSLPSNWWRNTGFVVEGLPGAHPLLDQHHFIPLNGRHVTDNFNPAGFDLTRIDVVGKTNGGWYTENPYATRGYSEAHLIYGLLFPKNKVPLYDETCVSEGLQKIHQRATVERKEMSGKVVEKIQNPYSSFSGSSNIGFLERQYIEARGTHPRSDCAASDAAVSDINDGWLSKSPLKENSCSETKFVEALRLNSRRTDSGVGIMANPYGSNPESQPLRTAVKGKFTTEKTK